jgi:gas vesicle protein
MENIGRTAEPEKAKTIRKPRGKAYRSVPDVRSLSMLGIGMIVGTVIGAGITLLVAPTSGREMRRLLGDRAGRVRSGGGVWYKLGKELRKAAAAKRKQLERQEARERVQQRPSAQPVETV